MSKFELIFKYLENRKNSLFQENGKANFPSDKIWQDIAKCIENEHKIKVSSKYIYNIVNSNKYNLKDKLGIAAEFPGLEPIKNSYFDDENNSSCSSNENDINDDPKTINFAMTLSLEEWNLIKPIQTFYSRKNCNYSRAYSILAPEQWTPIFYSHFWQHTKLNCSLTFKNAKVYECGENYIEVNGKCTECQSVFFASLEERPAENTRVLFSCKYIGEFNKIHTKKRNLSGTIRKEIAENMLTGNIMPSAYRRTMANRLMSIGDEEPPHLPTSNTLRIAVHECLKAKRPADDLFDSIYKAKYMYPYNEYIQDIGIDKFFVYYWSTLQIHVYNAYCKSKFSKIAIDATGNVVRKIMRPSGYSSGYLFLYDVAVRDPISKMQYSVCNMISERHDSDSIAIWLKRWIRDGANNPTEIVCDMSLALLSAISKAFLEMSLTSYINFCYNVVFRKCTMKPKIFIRSDVAHVIKMVLGWKCFKNTAKRTKEFYVRSLIQLLLCTDFDFAKRIVTAIFSVALCETDGNDEQGCPNFCDTQKIWLKGLISHGHDNNLEKIILELITDGTEENDKAQHLPPMDIYNDEDSLFFSWALVILEEAKLKLTSNGDRDNMQFLPEIIKPVLSLLKLLPLWSAIMTPYLRNSGTTCSSATVESNFNDIKNRIFSNKTLPIRIDDFICQHITSLEGTMKLVASATKKFVNLCDKDDGNKLSIEKSNDNDKPLDKPTTVTNPIPVENEQLHEIETLCVENFRGQGTIKPKRPRKSYLETQTEWEHIDLSDTTTAIPIARLREVSTPYLGTNDQIYWNRLYFVCVVLCLLKFFGKSSNSRDINYLLNDVLTSHSACEF